ncbi:YgaP family membrane protein, partial [Caldisalinibacter kiritimatiensis]|uniref:YgaP family membrane protein n=1 Tax=Caldisalinibacter kiritimatiensis TaxID=1304284 RepID=UPI00054EC201
MEKNVGDVDAYLRITGGLTVLGLGIMKKSSLLVGLGAMKVAEGVTRFCPLLYITGYSTNHNKTQVPVFSKTFTNDKY